LDRPCLIWDGDCGFCRRSVQHLRLWVGERVAFEPYQTAHVRFPAIPLGAFCEAVHLVEPDGRVSRGAEAFFRALAHGGQALPLAVYRGLPGVAALSEWVYRQVAAHQIPDPGQHRTLFYGEYSNRAGGTREPVAAGVGTREEEEPRKRCLPSWARLIAKVFSAPQAEKPPPIREVVRVAGHADSWGVPAEWA
jgi:predicted DCC family thiol-disulfide oxidoreductase YuxK